MFWADVTIAARYDDGDYVGYTKVVRDMTEQREYERALEHERERLEFLNRIIRHNILNGLNLVGARTDLLANRHVDDSKAEEHLRTIRTRVDDLSSLIDTMRTFMDAILTDADHETHPVPVQEELDEKIALARQTYDDAEFSVHDLPEESVRVIADELLGELFENVLSNAVVHNDKETPKVEVWTSQATREVPIDPKTGRPSLGGDDERGRQWTAEERSVLTVHVADNGPGIPDEDKRAVLEKGVSELAEPGNGFGLYLVKEMMHAYGGAVDIRDNDGEGVVFDMTFVRTD
jgi:signal transduction histidine kinase